MSDNPLNQALEQLDTTIKTIQNKVEVGKQRVSEYKKQILLKLNDINEQINAIKNNNNLTSIPALRQQLLQSQTALAEKTNELQATKQQLQEATNTLQQLQQNSEQLNRDIQQKTEEINRLKADNSRTDQKLMKVVNEKSRLDE